MKSLIHNCDCIDFMKNIPDNFFNLSLTDPPYNVGFKYNTYEDNKVNYKEWCDIWFNELLRICETVVLTTGYKNASYWYTKNPKGVIYWIKSNQNSPSTLGGFNCVELVFYFGKLQKRIGQDYFIYNIGMQNEASFHSCPKYYPAWKYLLNLVSKKENKVFDPFLGSGTTRIACYELGLDFEGCELDVDYYSNQEKRFIEFKKYFDNTNNFKFDTYKKHLKEKNIINNKIKNRKYKILF